VCDRIGEIHSRRAHLVIVGNGAPHFAVALREDFNLDAPRFVDPELKACRAAGLRRGPGRSPITASTTECSSGVAQRRTAGVD